MSDQFKAWMSARYPLGLIPSRGVDEDDLAAAFSAGQRAADTPDTPPLCTLAQALSFAPTCRMTASAAQHWWHTRNASGWTKGSTGGGAARKITSWQSDMSTSGSWAEEAVRNAARGVTPASRASL